MTSMILKLTEEEFQKLWQIAAGRVYSFMRDDPRKPWTDKERKEVITLYLKQMSNKTPKSF